MPDSSTISCPHCGKQFVLTEDYLAQYGGQELVCDQCDGAMMLPHSLAELESAGSPAPGAIPTLSYAAPPEPKPVRDGIWRQDMSVVKIRGPKLPRRCCVCGEAVTSGMIGVIFTWNTRITVGYMGDPMAETVTIWYGYCREHTPLLLPRSVRLIRWILVPVICILALATAAAAGEGSILKLPFMIALGTSIAFFLASLVLGNPPISLAYIVKDEIWLNGFGEGYLAHLPSYEEYWTAELERMRTEGRGEVAADSSEQPADTGGDPSDHA